LERVEPRSQQSVARHGSSPPWRIIHLIHRGIFFRELTMVNTTEALRIAFAHHQAGQLREAETIYRQILEVEPGHAESVHLLGLVAHQTGRHDRAVQLLNQAIALRGDRATYHCNLGAVYHVMGRIAEAETCLRRALDIDPDLADAHYNLGNVLRSLNQTLGAIAAYQRTIQLKPTFAEPYNHLGALLQAQGDLSAAILCFQQAVQLNPRYLIAYGNLGAALKSQGNLAEAIACYKQAVRMAGDNAEPHFNLGTFYEAQQQYESAIACYREALRQSPHFAPAHINLGAALNSLGNVTEAIACYEQAVRLVPDNAQLHFNLGAVHQGQRQFEQAVACYREAARLNPHFLATHINLGAALRQLNRLEEAIASFQQALTIQPDFAEAHFNIGSTLFALDDRDAAAAAYGEALRQNPDYVDAIVNLGDLMQSQSRLDESLELYNRAIELKPTFAMAYLGRANVYALKSMTQEAIANFSSAIAFQPNYPEAYTNWAVLLNEMTRPDEAIACCLAGLECEPTSAPLHATMANCLRMQGRIEEAIAWQRKSLASDPDNAAEHSNLLYNMNAHPGYDPSAVFQEHLAWAKRHAEPLTLLSAPHDNNRLPDRRLRIGYVSPHFRQHAVNYFVEPVLTSHARRDFEIFCYDGGRIADKTTTRLRVAVDHWREVRLHSDEQLARLIRDDAIDILVDLTGHIGGNRLLVFARKPAPIQVTYIGYQNTTGMSAMDYRLTDLRADPPGVTDPYYTEQLVRLPRCFFCYQPAADPAVTPLPALKNGYVTFGSFNSFFKVTPQAIDTWLNILARVPRSRLLVLAYRGGYVERNLDELARAQGIDPQRIELSDKLPRDEYARFVQRADVALDPFPFNGHTTTCDSIWLGVPVVMLEGKTYASRFGGSVLANVGLERWIARTSEQYADLAVELAGDLDRLARLRAELRPRMTTSVLLDAKGFTRNLEQAYRQMWHTWCAQSQPGDLY
jgi:predicted O-linked N-acetylglucosamine transferase (SPINDLY family)